MLTYSRLLSTHRRRRRRHVRLHEVLQLGSKRDLKLSRVFGVLIWLGIMLLTTARF